MRYNQLNEDKKGYVGYLLPEAERSRLLEQFPPKYSKVIAHHITTKFGVTEDEKPEDVGSYNIIGHADSEDGIEALVVSINGTTERDDGSYYHITWSLDPNKYKPKDSNKLVKNGWRDVGPVPVDLIPEFFPFGQ